MNWSLWTISQTTDRRWMSQTPGLTTRPEPLPECSQMTVHLKYPSIHCHLLAKIFFMKVRWWRRILGAIYRVDWPLVISIRQMDKFQFKINHDYPIYGCMLTGIYDVGLHEHPDVHPSSWGVYELSNRSTILSRLRDPRIVLVFYGLDRFAETSRQDS